MGVHIYRCENPKRTRKICPHHKQLEYGELQEFYDTTRIFFDCGTFADYGYGYYNPPTKYKRLKIYWDSELNKHVLVCAGFKKLFSHVNINKVKRIAKDRLKENGVIKILN
jgi:SAM-dependent MidA family methyltransferase